MKYLDSLEKNERKTEEKIKKIVENFKRTTFNIDLSCDWEDISQEFKLKLMRQNPENWERVAPKWFRDSFIDYWRKNKKYKSTLDEYRYRSNYNSDEFEDIEILQEVFGSYKKKLSDDKENLLNRYIEKHCNGKRDKFNGRERIAISRMKDDLKKIMVQHGVSTQKFSATNVQTMKLCAENPLFTIPLEHSEQLDDQKIPNILLSELSKYLVVSKDGNKWTINLPMNLLIVKRKRSLSVFRAEGKNE